jgi:hypothetical protein
MCVLNGMFASAGSDISCLLNGLEQLSFAFHELGIINVAFAIMQISTAAALWPASTIYIGVGYWSWGGPVKWAHEYTGMGLLVLGVGKYGGHTNM